MEKLDLLVPKFEVEEDVSHKSLLMFYCTFGLADITISPFNEKKQ